MSGSLKWGVLFCSLLRKTRYYTWAIFEATVALWQIVNPLTDKWKLQSSDVWKGLSLWSFHWRELSHVSDCGCESLSLSVIGDRLVKCDWSLRELPGTLRWNWKPSLGCLDYNTQGLKHYPMLTRDTIIRTHRYVGNLHSCYNERLGRCIHLTLVSIISVCHLVLMLWDIIHVDIT